MNARSRHRHSARRGYTLVEALVAGVVLMIGISAASQLSLTLITQDEVNQRSATALNYLETVARLYQGGLDEADIRLIVPADPVVTTLTITPSTPAVTGLGTMEAATISVTFKPVPSTQTWTTRTWTAGHKDASRTSTIVAYRSSLSRTIQ